MDNNNVAMESFSTFFEGWLIRQKQLYDELVVRSSTDEGDCNAERDVDLINRVITHYAEYYSLKSQMTMENVFRVMNPPWLTTYERILLWLGGFKPGLVLRIAEKADFVLEQEQKRQMEQIRAEVAAEEAVLMAEFERHQGLLMDSVMVAMAARRGSVTNGEIDHIERGVERYGASLDVLVQSADRLRIQTVKKVMSILNLAQKVRFLMAAARRHLSRRWWGLRMDRRT